MKNIRNSFEKQSFMVEYLLDITAEITNNKWNSIYYRKPNDYWIWFDIWIDQKDKKRYLECSYLKIWSVFEYEFGMKDNDIQSFISDMVLKHTEWGLVIPIRRF